MVLKTIFVVGAIGGALWKLKNYFSSPQEQRQPTYSRSYYDYDDDYDLPTSYSYSSNNDYSYGSNTGHRSNYNNSYYYDEDDDVEYENPWYKVFFNKASSVKQNTYTLPGGLRLVLPMMDNYVLPQSLKLLATSPEEIVFEDLDEIDETDIIEVLESKENDFKTLCAKNRVFVCLDWLAEEKASNIPISRNVSIKLENTPAEYRRSHVAFCEIENPNNKLKLKKDNKLILCNDYGGIEVLFKRYKGKVFIAAGKPNELNEFVRYRKCDVYKQTNTFVFESALRSIDYMQNNNMSYLVFPQPILRSATSYNHLVPRFHESINKEQRWAVHAVVNNIHGRYPFILFGPPGTGKTVTIAIICHQLLAKTNATILICTPSGAAADVVMEKLSCQIDDKLLFRLNSLGGDFDERNRRLDNVICSIARQDGSIKYGIPSLQVLKSYRIIVCTLGASSYLSYGGMPRGHFSHIIIDEAGQATEYDTWIPLGGLVGPNTKVVLSGDPKQLAPVVMVNLSKDYGSDISMLKRLSEMACYKNDGRLMCMLTRNYRSHKSIIDVPSNLFYDSKLIAMSDQSVSPTFRQILLNQKVPIIFYSIPHGKEEQKSGEYSFRNLQEVNMVAKYINILMNNISDVIEEHIGVVSPYSYQTDTLRQRLQHYDKIAIDSVEKYQGSERRIIIITTTRTNDLGFIGCPLRFNTAITRAKELLIVIGNAKVLQRSRYWREFIKYCKERQVAIYGKKFNTIDELKVALRRAWSRINVNLIASAVDNWPKRLHACVEANGGYFEI